MTTVRMPRSDRGDRTLYRELRRSGLTADLAAAALRLGRNTGRRLEAQTGPYDETDGCQMHSIYASHRDRGLAVDTTADLMALSRQVVWLAYEPAYQRTLNARYDADPFAPWENRAVCARSGIDDQIFFVRPNIAHTHRAAWAAVAMCRVCPVRRQCAEEAIDAMAGGVQEHMVRGGLTPRELARAAQARTGTSP